MKWKRYLSLVASFALMLVVYQNCDTARLEVVKKKVPSTTITNVQDPVCVNGQVLQGGTCVSEFQDCGARPHMSMWYAPTGGDIIVQRFCSATGSVVDDRYEELRQYECRDGLEVELSNTQAGNLIEAAPCVVAQAPCDDKLHGENWWVVNGEVSDIKTCQFTGSVTHVYEDMREYTCDNGVKSLTGNSEFGKVLRLGDCSQGPRNCETQTHGSVFYQNEGSILENKQCSNNTTVSDYYHKQIQYSCVDGDISATGKMKKSEQPYRSEACPDNAASSCGARINGEVWYATTNEEVKESVACGNGTSADRAYVKEVQYRCDNTTVVATGVSRPGALIRYGECTYTNCLDYVESEFFLKDLGELTQVENSCQGDPLNTQVKEYKLLKEFSCSVGVVNSTSHSQVGDFVRTLFECPIPKCGIDSYKVGSGCVPVGIGSYSPNNDDNKYACTNGPDGSVYSTSGQGGNLCSWSCQSGYRQQGSLCYAETCTPGSWDDCQVSGGVGRHLCNSLGTNYGMCTGVTCNEGYTKSGDTCILTPICSPASTATCSVPNGTGSKTCNSSGSAYGSCEPVSCNTGYKLENGSCVIDQVCTPLSSTSCPVTNGTGVKICNASGSAYGSCIAATCESGYSLIGGACVQNICTPNSSTSCSITNGAGTKTCNSSGSGYGSCTVTSCSAGYSKVGNSCVKDLVCTPNSSTGCSISNGSGTKTCNSAGSAYGSCVVSTCNNGYRKVGNSCVQNVCTPYSSAGCSITNGAGTKVCNSVGSGYGSCTVSSCNSGYSIVGNSCVKDLVCTPNSNTSCSVSNGIGSKTCSSSGSGYGSCRPVSCNSGYRISASGSSCELIPKKYYWRWKLVGTSEATPWMKVNTRAESFKCGHGHQCKCGSRNFCGEYNLGDKTGYCPPGTNGSSQDPYGSGPVIEIQCERKETN